MEFQDPDWRFSSPGPVPIDARLRFLGIIRQIAAQGRVQDILEEFKARFTPGPTSRSSTVSWADSDLSSAMELASTNAPVFIEAFLNGCQDARELGCHVPSLDTINRDLAMYKVGFYIEGDRIVQAQWLSKELYPGDTAPADDSDFDQLLDNINEPAPAREVESTSQMQSRPHDAREPVSLRIFLCHSSGDKAAVKKLYRNLTSSGYKPWLDTENLLPGQDWEAAIKKAVRSSHVVVVCLSAGSVTKTGFVQKEIRLALDVADEQPEGRIFIIPAKLEDCEVPDRLSRWHWVNLFAYGGFKQLLQSLKTREAELTKS